MQGPGGRIVKCSGVVLIKGNWSRFKVLVKSNTTWSSCICLKPFYVETNTQYHLKHKLGQESVESVKIPS